MSRVVTGIEGLDQILHRGIPEFSTVLIAGAPGTGKTVLTQHILFNNAKSSKVVYLTTLSEPTIKVIRYQQKFDFFDPSVFSDSVVYHDMGKMIRAGDANAILECMDELVQIHRPSIVAIDSIKVMTDMFSSLKDFRVFIYELNLRLSIWGCTVLLVGEYCEGEIRNRPEAAIADGIIYLHGTEESKHQKRFIKVLKMRGTEVSPGEHRFKISRSGIEVFPRLNPEVNHQVYLDFSERQLTGILGLDEMMRGGIPQGTNTFVTGSTGTGKTILAMSWLVEGARTGEAGLIITFDEHPAQLISGMRGIGWNLEPLIEQGLLRILHLSPIEVDLDEQIFRIQKIAQENGIKRIVVDSITTFEIGLKDKYKYTDYMWSMSDFFKMKGISLMLLSESPELFSIGSVSKHSLSYMADNIIFLHYGQADGSICREIGVLKMRGSGHSGEVREYLVTSEGPCVRKHLKISCDKTKIESGD